MTLSRRTALLGATAAGAGFLASRALSAGTEPTVSGYCHADFTAVREAYEKSFQTGRELGGAISLMIDGETVIDLWGGYKNPEKTERWEEDTLVCTMSVSKGIVATCAHILIDRGHIDPNERVAAYWPEFAQAGKENITVTQLLSHKAALSVADAAEPGDALEWEPLVHALEVQEPIWEPGSKGTYHATTYGHLVGELVRRVSGKDISAFVRDELAEPLGAEFIFGCSDSEYARVAPPVFNPENALVSRGPRTDDLSVRIYRLLGERGVLMSKELCRSIFPSASGISNARSLARIFGALARGGSLGDYQLMRPETIKQAATEQWYYNDPIHQDLFRVAMGYLLTSEFTYFGPNTNTFGTAGSGGYLAFADPDRKLGFSYTPVRFTSGHGTGEQPHALIDTIYRLV